VKYNFLKVTEPKTKYEHDKENKKYKPEPSGCHHPSLLASNQLKKALA
jgi:hypothetical protein